MSKVVFLHCPKTGGTSLAKAFGFKRVGRSLHSPLRGKLVQAFVKRWDPLIVSFLRDPQDRAKSLYRFIRDREDYKIGATKATQPCVPLSLCKVFVRGADLGINDFYRALLTDGDIFKLACENIVHLRKQVSFVSGPGEARVQFFDFHRYNEEVVRLAEYLGREVPKSVPWIYKRKAPVEQDELEDDVKELIAMRYAEDYELIREKLNQ